MFTNLFQGTTQPKILGKLLAIRLQYNAKGAPQPAAEATESEELFYTLVRHTTLL